MGTADMSTIAAFAPWSVEAFLDWESRQDERYELVGGFPLKMMTGATLRHDRVVVNLLVALGTRLGEGQCIPFTAGVAMQTSPSQIRRPDVGIDCGPTDPDAGIASEPTVVFEVLSPSTRDFDSLRKIDEYKSMPFLRHIVLLEQDQAVAIVWSRIDGAVWDVSRCEGLDTTIALSGVGVELPLAEIYKGLLR